MEYSMRYYYGKPVISKVLTDWSQSLQGREIIVGQDWFVIAPASIIRSLEISEAYFGPVVTIPVTTEEWSEQEIDWAVCSNSLYFYIEQFAVDLTTSGEGNERGELFVEFDAAYPGAETFISNYLRNLSADQVSAFAAGDELANRDFISYFDEDIKKFCNR
jgi:hypothetical protein